MPPYRPIVDYGAADTQAASVHIPIGKSATLEGELSVPERAPGIVIVAHGRGSNRHSERNRMIARTLRRAGMGTLLFDMLTPTEAQAERFLRFVRSDVPLLTERLLFATHWLREQAGLSQLPLAYLGASTGSAAALRAAALAPEGIRAVVSRGGRPHLAGDLLSHVRTPTLLLVGGADEAVIEQNRAALAQLGGTKKLEIIPGASHLFEEPGTLQKVSELTTGWFSAHFGEGAADVDSAH